MDVVYDARCNNVSWLKALKISHHLHLCSPSFCMWYGIVDYGTIPLNCLMSCSINIVLCLIKFKWIYMEYLNLRLSVCSDQCFVANVSNNFKEQNRSHLEIHNIDQFKTQMSLFESIWNWIESGKCQLAIFRPKRTMEFGQTRGKWNHLSSIAFFRFDPVVSVMLQFTWIEVCAIWF